MNDDSAPGAAPSPAVLASGTLGPPVASLDAIGAAHRIVAWHRTAKMLFSMIHAEIMEAAWIIRREYPERSQFLLFARARGLAEVMAPEQIWLAAETWEVQRSQRALRDLVSERPAEAMAFVHAFVAEGGEREIEALEDDDRRVAEILGSPPRKRHSAIQHLIASERAADGGRSPADVEQIRTLTEERDEALGRLEARNRATPAETVNDLVVELVDVHALLADIAGRYEAVVGEAMAGAGAALESAMLDVATTADRIISQGERIAAAAMGGPDAGG